MKSLGNQIKDFLKKRRVSQADLAKMVGASQPQVSGWLSDTKIPRADKIIDICGALNCTPDELLGYSEGGENTQVAQRWVLLFEHLAKFSPDIVIIAGALRDGLGVREEDQDALKQVLAEVAENINRDHLEKVMRENTKKINGSKKDGA